MRLVDFADPFAPREVGHYLPEPAPGAERPSSNDVTVDERGLVYLVDRVHGVDIIETSAFLAERHAVMDDVTKAKRGDVYPIGKKNPNLPFHPAVRAGDFIFVSGQVAKDADNNMIDGTIEVETRATIETIERILARGGRDARRCRARHHLSRRIPATSAATTRYSARCSRMRSWPAPPSRRAP